MSAVEAVLPSVPKCDFCTHPDPAEAFGCADFVLPPMFDDVASTIRSTSAWLACSGCAPLVAERRWEEIVERAIAAHVASGTLTELCRDGFTEYLRITYRVLAYNLTGESQTYDQWLAGNPGPDLRR